MVVWVINDLQVGVLERSGLNSPDREFHKFLHPPDLFNELMTKTDSHI